MSFGVSPEVAQRFYVGLDLGQARDYTALTVMEWLTGERVDRRRYHIRWLQRFRGVPYPQIVASVLTMLDTPQLAGKVDALCVDATGVGRPVVDMFAQASQRCPLVAITITGGDTVNHERNSRDYRVPKRDLASVLQVALQEERLMIADALLEASALVSELLNFKVKINTATGHDSYEAWREAEHDDLVLATALPLWYAERGRGAIPLADEPDPTGPDAEKSLGDAIREAQANPFDYADKLGLW